jgi:integrase
MRPRRDLDVDKAAICTDTDTMTSFTNRILATAVPPCTVYDTRVRGLHCRIHGDRRTFYLYYRTRERVERRQKIGEFGVLSIAQARDIASEWLAQVAAGRDPAREKRAAQMAPTIADLADRYLSDHAALKKPRGYAEDKRLVEKIILPKIGRMKTNAFDMHDADQLHQSLKATPTQANRVMACLSRMMTLAEKWGLRAPGSNPCRYVSHFKENKRRRYMRQEEAPRIAAVLERYEPTRPESVAFIYLLMLSGARPDEISRARRDWVERVGDRGVLRLPDAKTGARSVYLPPQVMRLIDSLPETRTGKLLTIKSPKALWDLVRVEAGVPDLRLYDLRHTFASAALKAGYSLDQIGELLGHASAQTTKRYAHLVEEKAHEAAASTASLIQGMLTASSPTSSRESDTRPPQVEPSQEPSS